MGDPLLSVEQLAKTFRSHGLLGRRNSVDAVCGISFEIAENETFALVGESGSGKSTTARMVLRLERPSGGTIRLRGRDIFALNRSERRAFRSTVQAVFQDPWSSFNPRLPISYAVAEPLLINTTDTKRSARRRVPALLEEVGLDPRLGRLYPHELSGGMRQRVAVARALALKPALVVLDEPVSSLDVSIRAQIMNLLKDLQESHRMSYLLIAHDLATVRYLADTIAVMHDGRIVEAGPSELIFERPSHPYTQSLLAAAAGGDPPDNANASDAALEAHENGCAIASK